MKKSLVQLDSHPMIHQGGLEKRQDYRSFRRGFEDHRVMTVRQPGYDGIFFTLRVLF